MRKAATRNHLFHYLFHFGCKFHAIHVVFGKRQVSWSPVGHEVGDVNWSSVELEEQIVYVSRGELHRKE